MMKSEHETILDNIELLFFLIGIILQDFAVVKVGTSGIPLLFVISIFIAVRHKFLTKFNIIEILLILVIFIKICFDKLFLINIPIMSIFRLASIIFIFRNSYNYTEYIIKKYGVNKLSNMLLIVSMILMLYGIYSIVAFEFRLPLFLNIFRNNPSYFDNTGMYSYYGGWTSNMRVVGTFAEPSMYAYFLIIIINVIYSSKLSKYKKIFLYLLACLNLYYTYSRTGYLILVAMIFVISIYKLLRKFIHKKLIYKIILPFIILSPFVNILIMYIANNRVFTDLSSYARTNSAIYYLMESCNKFSSFIFGHGYKSIQLGYDEKMLSYGVEAFSHNGYVEILYEFGCVFLFIIIYLLVKCMYKIPKIELRLLSITTIIYGCSFTSFFNIESMICLYGLILCSYQFIYNEENNDKSAYEISRVNSLC